MGRFACCGDAKAVRKSRCGIWAWAVRATSGSMTLPQLGSELKSMARLTCRDPEDVGVRASPEAKLM